MNLLKFNSLKLTVFLTVLESFLVIYLMKSLSLVVTNTVEGLFKNVAFIGGLYIVNRVIQYLKLRNIQVSKYYISVSMRSRVVGYYSKMKYNKYREKTVGERASLMINDVMNIMYYVVDSFYEIVTSISLIISSLITIFLINRNIFFITLIMSVVLILVPKLFQKRLSRYISDCQTEKEIFLGRLTEQLSGFFEYMSTSSFIKFRNNLSYYLQRYSSRIAASEVFASKMSTVVIFSANILTLSVLTVTSYYVITTNLNPGILLSMIGIITLMSDGIQIFFSKYTFYKSGISLYNEKFKDIGEPIDDMYTKPFFRINVIKQDSKVYPEKNTISEIRTKSLVIKYGDSSIPIKDIVFEKGKKYAITGESGCGKSSLQKAIIGIIDNYEGDILIDGISKNNEDILFDKIGYISQDTFLFKDSVKNNISLGNDDADCEKLLKKLDLTKLSTDYMVEENARNLSGGQKQRISIARSLALDKDVIFMDEATSSLDKNTAIKIEKNILKSNKTVVMITHRLHDEIRDYIDEVIHLS